MMFIHHSDSFVSRLMSSSQASAGPWNKNLKILTWKFYSTKLHAFKIRRRRTTLSVPSVVSFLYVRIFPVLTRHSFPDFDCPCPQLLTIYLDKEIDICIEFVTSFFLQSVLLLLVTQSLILFPPWPSIASIYNLVLKLIQISFNKNQEKINEWNRSLNICNEYTYRNVNDHRKRHFDEKYYFGFGFGTKDLVWLFLAFLKS